ncbi:MAG TPA: DNA methyltransferase [Phycisphaerae bacterium]|jgi:DNA modification methylase
MSAQPAVKTNAPEIRIPVTEGNLRNGHLYVRDFLWFFPKSAIRGERVDAEECETCTLEIPGVGSIETDIDSLKGIFRWRGWKRVFAAHRVRAGDYIAFVRDARNRFRVRVEHVDLDGLRAPKEASSSIVTEAPARARTVKRCNDLSGDEWLRYSLSIWSDVRKTAEEAALNHPAMFPTMLCERIATMFLRRRTKHRILDPFMGSGSTLVAARNLGKVGVGLEISPEYAALAERRLNEPSLFRESAPEYRIIQADARELLQHVDPCSIDLCITSPPYWDILNQTRSADYKEIRHYGNLARDLGTLTDYNEFMTELVDAFYQVHQSLRPGAYCVVVVMDLRKKNQFYAFHSDLARRLVDIGFVYDDLIIWDRRHEYNNLRPLGYPSVFRINKVHEFVLIFQRPRDSQHNATARLRHNL